MNGFSPAPRDQRLSALKSLIPEAFSEGKIDWEKLKAALGEDVNFSNERYVLNWAGKSEAFRILQEPSSATLVPVHEESVDFDSTQNIFIEGENLEVLKALQKSYFGKVKMIYIDPPYNTGNDSFIYPDKFSETKEEYLKRVGDKDESGYMLREGRFAKNSKENGQYHSNWLNMMMPRLYLAKNLLREDGVIFVSIDDNEVHNLRLLMNEIFGEENFVAEMVWEGAYKNAARQIGVNHEYVLVYLKSNSRVDVQWTIRKQDVESVLQEGLRLKKKYGNDYKSASEDLAGWFRANKAKPVFEHRRFHLIDRNGIYKEDDPTAPGGRKFDLVNPITKEIIPLRKNRGWRFDQATFNEAVRNGRISFPTENSIMVRTYLHETLTVTPQSVFYQAARSASERLSDLMGNVFSFPKDEVVLQRFLEMATDQDSVILDFFAGSGTTAHAVMQLNKEDGGNRKYICVQLPEPCDEKSEAFKAGYKTIADIAKERIRRAGTKIRGEVEAEQAKQSGELGLAGTPEVKMPDLGFKVFRLEDSNFKQWRKTTAATLAEIEQQMLDLVDPVKPDAAVENIVYELLLKSGKDLNSKIVRGNGFYNVNDGELVLLLESASQEIVDSVIALAPAKVIALDRLFHGNDQLKTNTSLQFRDSAIEFITI